MFTNQDLAYISGFFDAEGSISILASTYKTQLGRMPRYDLSISITNTNRKILRWIASFNFGGFISKTKKEDKKNVKPCYNYTLRDGAAMNFLSALLPYLKIKQEKANLAIAFQRRKNLQRKTWHRYDPLPAYEVRSRKIFKHLISSAENAYNEHQLDTWTDCRNDTLQLAYLAGFFDGEGCVSLIADKRVSYPRYIFRVQITQNDENILTWIQSNFFGQVRSHSTEGCHRWSVSGKPARKFLRALMPYLKIKRDQAKLGAAASLRRFRYLDEIGETDFIVSMRKLKSRRQHFGNISSKEK